MAEDFEVCSIVCAWSVRWVSVDVALCAPCVPSFATVLGTGSSVVSYGVVLEEGEWVCASASEASCGSFGNAIIETDSVSRCAVVGT